MYKDDSLTLHLTCIKSICSKSTSTQSIHNKRPFSVYFRQLPFKNGFAVFAGLEQYCQAIL